MKDENNRETDPDGLDPSTPGAKMDSGKTMMGLLLDFPLALKAFGEVCTYGAQKYSPGGWQQVDDGERRYLDAGLRHMLDGEGLDKESGLLHQAHELWNKMAALELRLRRLQQ